MTITRCSATGCEREALYDPVIVFRQHWRHVPVRLDLDVVVCDFCKKEMLIEEWLNNDGSTLWPAIQAIAADLGFVATRELTRFVFERIEN